MTSETGSVRTAIASVLCNASNYPKGADIAILGRDLTELIDKVNAAVLNEFEFQYADDLIEAQRVRRAVGPWEGVPGDE